MKTLTLFAAVCATAMLLTTGCKSCSCHDDKDTMKTAAACDGSCCSNHDTCVKCCKDAEGCQKCCHKS